MTLSVDIRHRQGAFDLEAAFESGGRLTALFGTSGSGKTTLVNLVAGLLRPAEGRIAIDGRVLVDTAAGIVVPAHRRRIGYVFQDARLFPHLTVGQNLRYGRFFTPPGERYADEAGVVDLLGIGHLLDRRPGHLSGGEKQRVAIGRALIASPLLILMDEPLASLDDARKGEILPYIERLRDETRIPVVYVSHSIAEVSRLATDVVVLSGGRVRAAGPAAEVLSRPDALPTGERDETGALVDLEIASQDDAFGLTVLRSSAGEWRLPRIDRPVGTKVRARIRARDVMIMTQAPVGISALNVLAARVEHVTSGEGADALVTLRCGTDRLLARITRRSIHALDLAAGREVYTVVKSVTFDGGNPAHAAPRVTALE
ncbi:molybdenum ABC transporter ATP-binding protein [Aquibium sp. ELW1220]|uniref:molybdenum ABC transporter ATP-binding protein n=1 Tax=Aquibium sp. ELW1220 TaxID=2976766 RepID=UPI0025AFC65D|nr:molybdenum ABC transporter ATP-binding protein [Aquibium sp. ELW1220]MDN2579105.1 molybdenum ABC transporter ATP-binding protein [Aquibium sp. ELW1220]